MIFYQNIPCPIIQKKEQDSYLVIYKGELKWIFEYSLGYGNINEDERGIFYTIKGQEFYHREKGPAIIDYDETKQWYQNGKLHRLYGPAVEYNDGHREYWIDGIFFYEEEYWKKLKK